MPVNWFQSTHSTVIVHSDQVLVRLGSIENEQSRFGESIGISSTGTGVYLILYPPCSHGTAVMKSSVFSDYLK